MLVKRMILGTMTARIENDNSIRAVFCYSRNHLNHTGRSH